MKRIAVKAAKNISDETEETLQSTFNFRNALTDDLQRATALRADYDRLMEMLTNLRNSNEKLSQDPSKEDLEVKDRIEKLKAENNAIEIQLKEEATTLSELEHSLTDFDNKIRELQYESEQATNLTRQKLDMYAKYLNINIQSVPEGFRVIFLDLDESILLTVEEKSVLKVVGAPEGIACDIRDPLAVSKVLFKAREILKR